MTKRPTISVVIPCILAVMTSLASLPALSQDLRGLTRDQVITDIRNSDIGVGYAHMLNFFVDPSISASRLDADDGTRYDVFKLPLQYEFPLGDGGLELAVRGTLSHAKAENTFKLLDDIKATEVTLKEATPAYSPLHV